MPRGKNIPEGVREACIGEMAMSPKGDKGKLKQIAKRWDVSVFALKHMQNRNKEEIETLRAAAAQRSFGLALRAQERMMDDLEDDGKMAETSAKDKSIIMKNAADTGVSLVEGHSAPSVNINFGEMKQLREWVEKRDAKKKAELVIDTSLIP